MRFLGLDSSTQSLTALVIDTDTGEVLDRSVAFGKRLPGYNSPNGFLAQRGPARQAQRPADVGRGAGPAARRAARAPASTSRDPAASAAPASSTARSTSAVPLDEAGKWSTREPLVDQVRPLLSRKTAPIWMDSSTGDECAEIAAARRRRRQDGRDRRARVAIERFTGPQIRKFWKEDPAAYERTAEIHLVSSFIASLLAGHRRRRSISATARA